MGASAKGRGQRFSPERLYLMSHYAVHFELLFTRLQSLAKFAADEQKYQNVETQFAYVIY